MLAPGKKGKGRVEHLILEIIRGMGLEYRHQASRAASFMALSAVISFFSLSATGRISSVSSRRCGSYSVNTRKMLHLSSALQGSRSN